MYFTCCLSLRFSEEGLLVSCDTKGIVRTLSPSYGGLSWIPVLDTTKQVGNKSDHYFIVGMTHNPHELRCVYALSLLRCTEMYKGLLRCTKLVNWNSVALSITQVIHDIIEY